MRQYCTVPYSTYSTYHTANHIYALHSAPAEDLPILRIPWPFSIAHEFCAVYLILHHAHPMRRLCFLDHDPLKSTPYELLIGMPLPTSDDALACAYHTYVRMGRGRYAEEAQDGRLPSLCGWNDCYDCYIELPANQADAICIRTSVRAELCEKGV